jgi:hypothetical protein
MLWLRGSLGGVSCWLLLLLLWLLLAGDFLQPLTPERLELGVFHA